MKLRNSGVDFDYSIIHHKNKKDNQKLDSILIKSIENIKPYSSQNIDEE